MERFKEEKEKRVLNVNIKTHKLSLEGIFKVVKSVNAVGMKHCGEWGGGVEV